MRVSSVLTAVIVLVSVISLVCIWFYPSIQDFMASNMMWNGLRNFNSELSAANIDLLDELPAMPEQTVLAVIPYLEYNQGDLSRIEQFTRDGGTLLLMDDYGYGNSILAFLGVDIRFTNRPLLDPLFCYKNQSMPRITDFTPQAKENGIDVVMFNHATTLINGLASETIAWSSTASFLDRNENSVWQQDEPRGPFAVAIRRELGKGELVLISDPSIIINSVVGRDDNYDFIRYSTGDESGQKEILVDSSHLARAPLDVSQSRLANAREALSHPYALLGITAMIFIAASRFTLKKGETIG